MFLKTLNHKISIIKKPTEINIQHLYDNIEQNITKSTTSSVTNNIPIKKHKLTQKTHGLIDKREQLKLKTNRNTLEEIEYTEIKILVKKEIKKDLRNYRLQKINEIIENTGSTKKIQKELYQDRKLITHSKIKQGKMIQSRDNNESHHTLLSRTVLKHSHR